MKKYIFTFVLAIVSGLWMVSEGVEAAKGSILEETIGKPEGLLGRWLNVSNEENVSILTFNRSDMTPPYEGLVVAHNGVYGQEFSYYRDGDMINFISTASTRTGTAENKNYSFASQFSIEANTKLTIDSFYFFGNLVPQVTFYRDESKLADAQVLLSGRWYIENNTDTIFYSFLPDQTKASPNGLGGLVLKGAYYPYKIEQKEDGRWIIAFYKSTVSDDGVPEFSYQLCKLTMSEMVWIKEEDGEPHIIYLKRTDIAYTSLDNTTGCSVHLYARDDSGSSTVDPVDPNQIYATLTGDVLTVHNRTGAQVTFTLNNTSVNNVAARARANAEPVSFTDSVSIELSEDGIYEIWLTSEEWNYTVFGTVNYIRSGTDVIKEETHTTKKVLRGTQILIERGDKTFTLTGQEIN